LYDQRVVTGTGTATFGGTLASQQATASTMAMNVVDVEPIRNGMLIFAELIPPAGPKTQTSFFLKREDGRWRIVYDTFTANALAVFVQQQEQRRIDPNAKRASTQALRAADGIAATFRAVALEPTELEAKRTERGRVPSPRRR
jgi:hypothetical protein